MSVEFMKFKFIKKTSEKNFFCYKIISNNPYSDKNAYNGNSICYKLKQKNEHQFIYNFNNEYILAFEKIKNIPNFEDDMHIELINECRTFPIASETLDLYGEWVKFFVFKRIYKFCSENKGAYDYTKDNKYKILLFSDESSGIKVIQVFKIGAEVLTDRTVYLSVPCF